MNVNQFFGEKIKGERINKHLSQEQLALLANIDRTYISDIEKGSRKISLEIAYKLSKALGVSLSNILKEL